MERISEERAKELVPYESDFTGHVARYFTLTLDNDGWESITYYTNRKREMYANRDGDYNSWVYVLSNPDNRYFKVGKTHQESPEVRAKQISAATGVPRPYEVEWAFKCWDAELLEREVHKALGEYRVNSKKEFFNCDLEHIISSIKEIGANYL